MSKKTKKTKKTKEVKESTSLEVLNVIFIALQDTKYRTCGTFDQKIEDVEYDGDNIDGSIQLTLKDGTVWFLSSDDIISARDLE